MKDKPKKKKAAPPPEPEKAKKKTSVTGSADKQRLREGAGTLERMRTRIVGHGEANPFELKAHRLNFRTHPESQMKALRGSMDDLGWMRDVLVSKRTGIIVDGHARVEEARRRKVMVPVCYLDLSPEEENKALALLDPISEMAGRDDRLFMELLDTISTDVEAVNEALTKMAPLKGPKTAEEAHGEFVQTSTAILQLTTDVFFPSSNKWGIPDIRPDMLYDGDAPLTTWPSPDPKGAPQFYVYGEGGFDERVNGKIITFYTEDWRFERIWEDNINALSTLLPLSPAAFTSPDFSLWADDPLACQIWNIYRARWISRYWQEAGIKCIPSLATSTNPACYDFAYDGFPERPSIMSMQMRNGGYKQRSQVNAAEKEIAQLIERVNPQRLVIYGSSARDRVAHYLPGGVEYIWADDFSAAWFENGQKMKAEKMAANLGITVAEAAVRIENERKTPKKKPKAAGKPAGKHRANSL